MSDHTELLVWQKAMALAERVHEFRIDRAKAPKLFDQLCRSSSAIPANIAEGAAHGPAKYAYHVEVAIGEARELETHLELGRRVRAVRAGNITMAIADTIEVRKMSYGLLRYLRSRI